jgi:23S rRNA (adenine2030-N6)-methyltransferase
MNYRHLYHAGSFADVFKHSILCLLFESLLKKETGIAYIDTHAGAGLYDLGSAEALKTGEASTGILQLLKHASTLPPFLKPYIDLVQSSPQYPGSPIIARHFLRPQDEMILNEAHPEIHYHLKGCLRNDTSVAIHQRQAYEFLPAVLPPRTKTRALVLVDPPFEKPSEMLDMAEAMSKALAKFSQGVYALWFPLTDKAPTFYFPRQFKLLLPPEKHSLIEFKVRESDPARPGLIGCAMVIINPPWQFESELKILLPALWKALNVNKQGGYSITHVSKH